MQTIPRTRRLHRLVGWAFILLYIERNAVEPPPGCCAAVLARLQAHADPLDELYMEVLLAEARHLVAPKP